MQKHKVSQKGTPLSIADLSHEVAPPLACLQGCQIGARKDEIYPGALTALFMEESLVTYEIALPMRSESQGELHPGKFIHVRVYFRPGEQLCGRYGGKCHMWCRAIGSNISRMEVKIIRPDKTAMDVDTRIASRDPNIPGLLMTIEWDFEPRNVIDANGNVTFQCLALDERADIKGEHEYDVHFDPY
ncbi:hypothetical protein PoB_001138100 [Plakobranchus ocellatus]|uniref:Uncharacterized protein n=1 Tax=Plakobranchus ocellatus TaxID=259542 RepID=A0AAV3YC15_9GAST|nr:hypothetical protein PoB_001138100 [Plakobranchus ocellatus]